MILPIAARMPKLAKRTRPHIGLKDRRESQREKTIMQRIIRHVAVLAALGAFLPLTAQATQTGKPDPTPIADELVAPAQANKVIKIGENTLAYRAMWSETVLEDDEGEPQATISATSYILENAGRKSRRPVTFLFNGGPGASSTPLHFSAFGPRRRSEGIYVDNESTLLDVTDLVFIDPVGTGYSRELKKGGGSTYWSVDGDAKAALDLVHGWLKEHGRQKSPVFFAGESYGGTRLAVMSKDMEDINVKGLMFLSPATDMTASSSAAGNDQHFIFTLPSMAVAAWVHGRAGDPDATAAEIWENARAFAQSDYAVALQQGSALAPEVRREIAQIMSSLIGLSVDMIEDEDIRIGTQTFLEALLDDENKLVGRLDVRVTAEKRKEPINPNRPAAANDPSLGLGRSNVIRSESAAQYFREEIGVDTTRDYFSLTLDVNFNWNWSLGRGASFYFNATPNVAALMEKKLELRAMVISGYFDLATPVLAQRYAFTHSGAPLDRIDMFAQAAPHSPFDNDETRNALAARVRDFIREQSVK